MGFDDLELLLDQHMLLGSYLECCCTVTLGRRKQGASGGLLVGKQPGAWSASIASVATAPHNPQGWERACGKPVRMSQVCDVLPGSLCGFPLASGRQLRTQLAQMPACVFVCGGHFPP